MGPGIAAPRRRYAWRIGAALVLTAAAAALPPLVAWQATQQRRTRSMSNMRQIANGLLVYSQDYDDHCMPPFVRSRSGRWVTWRDALRPYVASDTIFSNPSNPVDTLTARAHDPHTGCPAAASYALNQRVFGVFSRGPFPLDNLELASQTVLLVEAGPISRSPRSLEGVNEQLADVAYGDTTDRYNGFWCYPSTHAGRMAVVAVDGHAAVLRVAHYSPADGPHDPLYGLIGGRIFNWNGGHPNGKTDEPVRQ